jgi:hypothetical protein
VQYGGLSRTGDLENGPPKPASEFTIKGGEKVFLEIDGIEVYTIPTQFCITAVDTLSDSWHLRFRTVQICVLRNVGTNKCRFQWMQRNHMVKNLQFSGITSNLAYPSLSPACLRVANFAG